MQVNFHKLLSDNKTFFYNWAYLNDKAQKEYIETGNIQPFNWRSGNNLWLYDIVILKDAKKVMRELIEKFKQELKVGECINWLRLDNEDYMENSEKWNELKAKQNEIIRKSEILKYKELDLKNAQINNVLNKIIQNLNFSDLIQFENYLY